jgi:hypothetical protein
MYLISQHVAKTGPIRTGAFGRLRADFSLLSRYETAEHYRPSDPGARRSPGVAWPDAAGSCGKAHASRPNPAGAFDQVRGSGAACIDDCSGKTKPSLTTRRHPGAADPVGPRGRERTLHSPDRSGPFLASETKAVWKVTNPTRQAVRRERCTRYMHSPYLPARFASLVLTRKCLLI